MIDDNQLIKLGKQVIQTEATELAKLTSRIDENFVKACRYMLACTGRIVVIGMGKSGHIGGKLAATLASTGSPAFFVHPGEASHGDLGMIIAKDVVVAISNSGETDEIVTILPLIKRLCIPLIALTSNSDSTIAKTASVHINTGVDQEACPLGLAPTASSTATLAMGDALAISLLESRGFTQDDFARAHPGGYLGRRLLLHVSDIMHTAGEVPKVLQDAPLSEALLEMTNKGLGVTGIVDEKNKVLGIFTDGDLRRLFDVKEINIHTVKISQIMTENCKTATSDILAAEALHLMEKNKINALLIVDQNNVLIGALNMHDLLHAGVV